jgi:hypothetical protein
MVSGTCCSNTICVLEIWGCQNSFQKRVVYWSFPFFKSIMILISLVQCKASLSVTKLIMQEIWLDAVHFQINSLKFDYLKEQLIFYT